MGASTLAPLPAASQGADDAARERDDARAARESAEADLDHLAASDADLEAEVARLDAAVAGHHRDLAAAVERAKRARSDLLRARSDVDAADRDVSDHRARVAERAVVAFVHPNRDELASIVGVNDIGSLSRMHVLLDEVKAHDDAILADLRSALRRLAAVEAEVAAAAAEAADAAAAARSALASLEASRAEKARLSLVLDARIAEVRAEIDALAAEEAGLTAIILQRAASEREPAVPATPETTTVTVPAPGTGEDPSTTTSRPGPTTTTTAPPDDPPGSEGFLLWPVVGPVTSEFGPRWGRMHNGIDIGVPTGTPIRAAADGEVFFSGVLGGYGQVILVDHGDGLVTLYAHQSRLGAAEGDRVARGQVIGSVGSTGNSTGPHLHFETRVDNVPQNPRIRLA